MLKTQSEVSVTYLFYRWENWSSESLGNLSKVTLSDKLKLKSCFSNLEVCAHSLIQTSSYFIC